MAERKRNRLGSVFLVAAIVGFLAVELQPWLPLASVILFRGLSLKALLAAFFEASLAGAFADWFAVSALFKDPLGIPLPHTNILAKNKDAIADAIPRFLTGFVSGQAIHEELGKIDYASKAAEALSGGEAREKLHTFLKSQASELLLAYGAAASGSNAASVSAEAKLAALRRFVDDALSFAADRVDAPAELVAILGWARKERFDQRALEGLAEYARRALSRSRPKLVALLTPIVKRNAGWQGLFIGAGTVERFLSGIQEELADIKADKSNEFRLFILSSISAYASRLASVAAQGGNAGGGTAGGGNAQGGTAERDKLTAAFRGALTSEEFRSGFARFTAQLLSRVGEDLSGSDGRLIPALERGEEALAARLTSDKGPRASFNAMAGSLIASVIERGRVVEGVTEYLAGLLRSTDERNFVKRIEESVWNDLQYIRVNGSVVGGLVGLVIALAKAALGGG